MSRGRRRRERRRELADARAMADASAPQRPTVQAIAKRALHAFLLSVASALLALAAEVFAPANLSIAIIYAGAGMAILLVLLFLQDFTATFIPSLRKRWIAFASLMLLTAASTAGLAWK